MDPVEIHNDEYNITATIAEYNGQYIVTLTDDDSGLKLPSIRQFNYLHMAEHYAESLTS